MLAIVIAQRPPAYLIIASVFAFVSCAPAAGDGAAAVENSLTKPTVADELEQSAKFHVGAATILPRNAGGGEVRSERAKSDAHNAHQHHRGSLEEAEREGTPPLSLRPFAPATVALDDGDDGGEVDLAEFTDPPTTTISIRTTTTTEEQGGGGQKKLCRCDEKDPWEEDPDEHEMLSKRRRIELAIARVAFLNANKTLGWRAAATKRFALFTPENRKDYCGVEAEKQKKIGVVLPEKTRTKELRQQAQPPIPRSFDARKQWPACAAYIGNIRDQSGCGSCWAVALGCGGGYPYLALQWVSKNRATSGSNYSSEAYCKPYPFPPKSSDSYQSPKCYQSCQYGYGSTYNDDKAIMGKNGPDVGHFDGHGNELRIQLELMSNGPVEATMTIYQDFYFYKTGIYWHARGGVVGAHAVKIIGWDEGYDQWNVYRKWWLVANSWNIDWGEKGFFRIIRGIDECGLESTAIDFPVY